MEEWRFTDGHCQAGVLKLLGDYVSLRVVDFLRTGELRFTQLQRSMGDVNSVTLTNRLKRLEGAGLVGRKVATVDRQSVTYSLTELGRGLLPVLREIRKFTLTGVEHLRDGALPPPARARKKPSR
jgi:DNA-binding HxlR family transcriptional regulator